MRPENARMNRVGFVGWRGMVGSVLMERMLAEGDFKARVLAECGEPDQVEVWEEERVYKFRDHPSYYGVYENYEYNGRDYEYGKPYRIRKLVIVEEWTYNHGPGRFMDHLRLENGVVRHIQSGDYGF